MIMENTYLCNTRLLNPTLYHFHPVAQNEISKVQRSLLGDNLTFGLGRTIMISLSRLLSYGEKILRWQEIF